MAEIASALVANIVTEILKKLVPIISQTVAGAWGVKGGLKKLKRTLEMILAVITDAERRQVNENAVRLWLTRLKDVVYDVDDVLDEFSYEAMRRADQMTSLKDKVRNLVTSSNPIAFPFKMAHKIKKVNENLNEMAKDMHVFGFLATSPNTTTSSIQDQSRGKPNRKTASYVDDSEIVGRENDKLEIVKLLLMVNNTTTSSSSSSSIENQNQYEKVSVISIVGMGGLGKTTLTQLVYNDDSVVKHFELKIWVCVSEDFDVFKILKNIIEAITNTKCDDVSNVDLLVRRVQEKLTGKKYLLVLDDLWNENDLEWQKLKTWLNVGAQGSKILISTRLDQVASVVRMMIPPYKLQKLSEAQCWSIINKRAFSPGGAQETPNMINIGKEIAKKCCGLPLAAIFLGGLMHSRKEESEWRSIKDQIDIWGQVESEKSIIPILKLSYDNLSSHLKQCFSYCCIFPKDWVINRETLIRLWMAEGFLPSSDGGNELSIEDIGNEYFKSLLSSSFFQDIEKDEIGNIWRCKMHDLVHDLAQKVIGKHECATIKVCGESANISEIRRLLLDSDEGVLRTLPKAKKLRTVVDFQSECKELDLECFFSNKNLRVLHAGGGIITNVSFSSIPKMKHLRYLDLTDSSIQSHDLSTICSFYNLQSLVLRWCRNVKSLPSNIGSLKNLRYLNVSETNIEVFPDSITSLCNLRMLRFDWCFHLKALPIDFGKLKHLRFLDLEGTKIQVLPESCTDSLTNLEIVHLGYSKLLNKEIKNWTKLKHLKYFKLDESPRGIEQLTLLQVLNYKVTEQRGIEELHDLNLLEVLEIRGLENVRDADRANLKAKINIRKLDLRWSGSGRSDGDSLVLEALQPHPNNLKELFIRGFMGTLFPMWMGGIGVSSSSSSSCLLVNLVNLKLWNCNRCEKLPALGQLPSLRYLDIRRMKSVRRMGEELYGGGGENLFPSLIKLILYGMESLEEWVAPPPLFSKIDNGGTFYFPLLENLDIRWCPKLTTTPTSFPCLKRLIFWDSNIEALRSLARDSGLTSLEIRKLPELIYFPSGLLRCLQNLQITYCNNFRGFRDLNNNNERKMSSSEENEVEKSLSAGTLDVLLNNSCSLQRLWLGDCPVITVLPDLQRFTTLQRLTIKRCNDELKKSLPKDRNCLSFIEKLDVDFWA